MIRLRSRAGAFAVGAATFAMAATLPLAYSAVDLGAQIAANVTVDPQLYKQVYYRPLSPVFSRGGRVTAVAGVPSSPRLFYMGAAGGGVWKTADGGGRWEPITDGQIGVGTIGAIDVALSDPNVIYMGTGSADPRGSPAAGRTSCVPPQAFAPASRPRPAGRQAATAARLAAAIARRPRWQTRASRNPGQRRDEACSCSGS